MAYPDTDPDNLQQWIRDYENRGSIQQAGYGYAIPRGVPDQIDFSLQLDQPYFDADGYTTAGSQAPSRGSPSSATSRSTAQSSLFSRSRSYVRSTGSWTTLPSRNPPHQTFVQQFRTGLEMEPVPETMDPSSILWCEFRTIKGCGAVFRLDSLYEWIDHHADHLRNTFPAQCNCWFCDDFPFVTQPGQDTRENFDARMYHIHGHIFDDHTSREQTRPDFHMVQHLNMIGEINEDEYNLAMNVSELPASMRLPGEEETRRASNREPEDRSQYSRHDLQSEERRRRREDSRRHTGRRQH